MTSRRMPGWRLATALVPVLLLSGAWTAGLAGSTASAGDRPGARLPDGGTVPTEPVEAPASVSGPLTGAERRAARGTSTDGIPSAALAAYQRAAQVLATADPRCRLDWPLLAAIGRVESDHGRYGGSVLTAEGVTRPAIYGIPLDGSRGTRVVTDTDGGRLDRDTSYDRAVGPLQFIPSTWAVVGVDGDGDGRRDPQDIDDAALATAVYLCSGDDDLSTRAGQAAAVHRYNHSGSYVRLVLATMAAYASGDVTAVPNLTTGTTTFTPTYDDRGAADRGDRKPRRQRGPRGVAGGDGGGSGGSDVPVPATPAPEPAPSDPRPPEGEPRRGVLGDTVRDVEDAVTGGRGDVVPDPVEDVLTAAEARARCLVELTPAELLDPADLTRCIERLLRG